jgi:hypothetical protein
MTVDFPINGRIIALTSINKHQIPDGFCERDSLGRFITVELPERAKGSRAVRSIWLWWCSTMRVKNSGNSDSRRLPTLAGRRPMTTEVQFRSRRSGEARTGAEKKEELLPSLS